MITLNIDKHVIEVETWDEVISRPGFLGNLNPLEHKLKAIIGQYSFANEVNCGLTNCHAPHKHGYIVSTEKGYETNIGNVCGKREFGFDFSTMAKKFARDNDARRYREAILAFSNRTEELHESIDQMCDEQFGANWIHRKISMLKTANMGCPEPVVRRIASMIKSGSNAFSIDREATGAEIEALEVAESRSVQRPHYISEQVASIHGMAALQDENDLRELLILNLKERLKIFPQLSPDTALFRDLRDWAAWIATVDRIAEQASDAIVAGRALLVADNLRPFTRLLSKRHELDEFRRFLNELPPK